MTGYSFLVVADRGRMKAFQVEHSRGRGETPVLADEIRLEEAGARFAESLTDRAGEFPSNRAMGSAHSSGERLPLEAENEARVFRHLAEKLTFWLKHYRPETWAFAAPAEINGAILEGLEADLRERLVENVRRDLVNIPVGEILERMGR